MATMIEFSVVLLIQRNCTTAKVDHTEMKRKNKPQYRIKIPASNIDIIAAVISFLGYIFFNVGYWNAF